MIWEEITNNTEFYGWDFLRPLIGKRVFWASVGWGNQEQQLPPEYPYYLIKTEGPNIEWIEQQAKSVNGHIFVMCLPNDYGYFDHADNITFLPCVEWHYQTDAMLKIFGKIVKKNVDKKISILTHRISYNKIVLLSVIKKYYNQSDICYSLHNFLENKNIHNWENTSSNIINYYKDYFLENFDYWVNPLDFEFLNSNKQLPSNDYRHAAYQECALNITNESWNYSGRHDIILPGPFITEKTLKCLLGGTAFLANGQYDTYGTLKKFGFEFDYGMDLSFDNVIGDLTRLEKLISCVKDLVDVDCIELYERTKKSCIHNKELIISGAFYTTAETVNKSSLERILNTIG